MRLRKPWVGLCLGLAACQPPAPTSMSLASPKPGEARPSAPTPTPRPPLVFDYPEVKAYPATFGTGEASIHTYDIFTQNQTPRAVSFKPLGGGKSLMFSTNYGGSEFFLVSTEPNFKVQGPVKLPYESSYILADERGNGQFLFWSTFVTGVVVFGMPPDRSQETATITTLNIQEYKPQLPTQSLKYPKAGSTFNFGFSPRVDDAGNGFLTGCVRPQASEQGVQKYHVAKIPVQKNQVSNDIELLNPISSYGWPLAVLDADSGLVLMSPSQNQWVAKEYGPEGFTGNDHSLGELKNSPSLLLDKQGTGSIFGMGTDSRYKFFKVEDYSIKSEKILEFTPPIRSDKPGEGYQIQTRQFEDKLVILVETHRIHFKDSDRFFDIDYQLSVYENGEPTQQQNFAFPMKNRILYSSSLGVDADGNGLMAIGTTANGGVDGKIHLIRMKGFVPQN